MNERFHSIARKVMVSGSALLLSFAQFFMPVYAFGNNWQSSSYYKSIGYLQGTTKVNSNNQYLALNVVDSNGNPPVTGENSVGVVLITNQPSLSSSYNNTQTYFLLYSFEPGWYVQSLYSTNNVTFTQKGQWELASTFTGQNPNYTATTVYYKTLSFNSSNFGYLPSPTQVSTLHSLFPSIPIIFNITNANDVLSVISLDYPSFPWYGTTSSGGRQWQDGNSLNNENTTLYSNVYTVMDINNDNSISEEEVNYYNVTNETNYDYSQINNSQDFDLNSFLYYVAVLLANGDNPAGDGSPNVPNNGSGGGIYVGDGSFTQSQSQTIEQNAINVSVSNNNTLSQENMQEINNIINNSDSDQTTFQDAVSNMNQFRGMAIAFASLAGVVLGWLPSWVVGLLGMMFSVLSVMIVIRLIHLFV